MTSRISLLLVSSLIFATGFNSLVVFAQEETLENSSASEAKEISVRPSEKVETKETMKFPFTRIFDITAYYSPVVGQERYVTGSYESDIRLNGRGTNGADGTPVYPGMIAAPKTYAFGTKMQIPGVGTVAVHDRGGAIQAAGKAGKHDRLDIWMGYGDKGLSRALGWGRRAVSVTVYGIDPSIIEQITLANYDESERVQAQARQRGLVKPPLFPEDVWYLSRGTDVATLQRVLSGLGYFKPMSDGFYGDETREAVLAFQRKHDLIEDEDELGAGHTGPQTRVLLEKVFFERRKTKLPLLQLGRGARGENVLKLQQILRSLGYDVAVTGVYDDQTETAVLKFQRDQKIITQKGQRGSGYFGHKTMSHLEKQYLASTSEFSKSVVIDVPEYLVHELTATSTGIGVRQLQQELRHLHYLGVAPTGFYGPVTAHAVFKFKQSQGFTGSESEPGATTFDSWTRGRLNQIVAARFYTTKMIATSNPQVGTLVAKIDK